MLGVFPVRWLSGLKDGGVANQFIMATMGEWKMAAYFCDKKLGTVPKVVFLTEWRLRIKFYAREGNT